jgi:hypothetical protein
MYTSNHISPRFQRVTSHPSTCPSPSLFSHFLFSLSRSRTRAPVTSHPSTCPSPSLFSHFFSLSYAHAHVMCSFHEPSKHMRIFQIPHKPRAPKPQSLLRFSTPAPPSSFRASSHDHIRLLQSTFVLRHCCAYPTCVSP